jgi:peptidoglycan/xylan/chitin deacetylase (PgdA/CDA1 family)
MYHQVTPNIHPGFLACSVTPRTLRTHMNILKLFRFNPITLDQLQDYRNGNSMLPKKPVLITFDDCYQECIHYAVPVLEEKGFSAVFYMPTDFAGTNSHWLVPELGFEFPIIGWDTVKRLDKTGFEIGSHTMSHPRLAEISANDCLKELVESRNILEDKLGHQVVHMAYPFGSFNETTAACAAEAGYLTSCTTEEGIAKLEDDPLLLPRINIMGMTSVIDFAMLLHFEGKYNTTRTWWLYVHGKYRGIGRLKKRIRNKLKDMN